MEMYDGYTEPSPHGAVNEHDELDDVIQEENDPNEEQSAFHYQNDLIKLDKLFSAQKEDQCDLFAMVHPWHPAGQYKIEPAIRIVPGEIMKPDSIILDTTTGQILFIMWLNSDEIELVSVAIPCDELQDILPTTFENIQAEFGEISKLNIQNRNVIGKRPRVIWSLNEAIESRSTTDLIEQNRRQAKERSKKYENDDTSGMF